MNETSSNEQISLNEQMLRYLDGTRKWTLFFAILGFIMLGLLVIFGFTFGGIMSSFGGEYIPPAASILVGILYLVIAIIYFFPMLFLLRFSTNTKRSIEARDGEAMETALKNLKYHYTYVGVVTIIFIGLYVVIGLLFGLGSLFT